jgi:CTP synthase
MRLREVGIAPDVLVCRTGRPINKEQKEKIALFCDVDADAVIEARDADTIYEIPLVFEEEGFSDLVVRRLGLPVTEPRTSTWREIVERIVHPTKDVEIAVVGKYIQNGDAYISIAESLGHAGILHDARVRLRWIDSEEIQSVADAKARIEGCSGLVVCPGFGARGIEGKIAAVQFARESGLPFLGICLGMQMAVIEFARNVCGLTDANTTETAPETPHPVIDLMLEQADVSDKGATMRLGLCPCSVTPGTLAHTLYGTTDITERHRHRYEFNNAYREQLANAGLRFSGVHPDKDLVEIIEVAGHPYFIACQFHPEFKSRPDRAHPLFAGLIDAALTFQAK